VQVGDAMKGRTGFTLIELLVGIATIALLMAILLPALRRAQDQARDVVCRSNLRGVGIAIGMYLEDHRHRMPDLYTYTNRTNGHLWWDARGNPLQSRDDYAYWGIAFFDYARERKLFGCPAFRNFSEMLATELLYGGDHKLIHTSAHTINGWLTQEHVNRMPRPAEVIVGHDHMEPRIEHGNRAGNSDMLFPSPTGVNLTHYRQGASRAHWYRGIFRHNIRSRGELRTGGSLNVLWLDTHVSRLNETTGDGVPKRWYDPLGKNP
jgi:prepilin-type N-terminal cleavage/methylation domain-containing protein/prepilin-type processing-associated H-X9-DG protein